MAAVGVPDDPSDDPSDDEAVSLRVPADPAFAHLPRVCLGVLLRVHRIDPARLGDLATTLEAVAAEFLDGGGEVTIDYRADDDGVEVVLSGASGTRTLEARLD